MNPLTRKITGLVVGLTVAAASVVALSPGASADVTYPMSTTTNVRTGPGTNYAVVGTVSGSQTFNCYQTGTSVGGDTVWGHLTNGQGYVSDYYISICGKTLAQIGLPVCGAPAITVTYPLIGAVAVYAGPGTSYKIVDSYSGSQTFNCYLNGTSVGGDVVWGHLNNGRGYIADYYINEGGKTLAQNGLKLCTTATPSPTPTPTPTPTPPPSTGKTYPVSATTIRLGPNKYYDANGSIAAGSYAFDCYALGGLGGGTDNVWGHLANGKGYVADWNINLGGKTLAQLGTLPKCTAKPAIPTTFTRNADNQITFKQTDSRWSGIAWGLPGDTRTIGGGGCGPSAMAMIITNLTGILVTPYDTATWAGAKGYHAPESDGGGSYHTLGAAAAQAWGLKGTRVMSGNFSQASIQTALSSGSMIWVCAKAASPFTPTGGHCIAIRGIASDGKWKVYDSASSAGHDQNATYAPATIFSYIKGTDITIISK